MPDTNDLIINVFMGNWIIIAAYLFYLIFNFCCKASKWPIDDLFMDLVVEPFINTGKRFFKLFKGGKSE